MRKTLKNLISKTLFFKYSLPNKIIEKKIVLSNYNDDCFTYSSEKDLSELIYQSILDYSYNEFEMTDKDLSILLSKALCNKIKYKEYQTELTKIKYGFYGEVLLYSMLYVFYNAKPIISRGYFYNPLENSETKGYDSYHLIENEDKIELWFGEVKFRDTLESGAKSAIEGLDKAFTDTYLSNNIIAMDNYKNSFNIVGSKIEKILDEWDGTPINIIEQVKRHNMILVYPILLVFPDNSSDYDEKIKSAINKINKKFSLKKYSLSIPYKLFFILLPVSEVKKIKKEVIEWIESLQPQI
jgi:hypothetical protein